MTEANLRVTHLNGESVQTAVLSMRGLYIACFVFACSACSVPATPSARHCFRNEFPIDGSKDVQELIVVIAGDQVSGEYNWLPAFKDRRLGQFRGSVHDRIAEARYDYQQEGSMDTTSIVISIEADQAVVTGGAPELGLDLTLRRVAC